MERRIKSFEDSAASGEGCFGGSSMYREFLNKNNVAKGSTIYDLCCGQGQQFIYLSELVGKEGKVIAADIVPAFAKEAQRNIKDLMLDNVEAYLMDCRELKSPFVYGGADVVVLLETLGTISIEDNMYLLDEAGRACKKGGTLIASAEAKEFYSCNLLSKGEVRRAALLLEKGIMERTDGLLCGYFSREDFQKELIRRGFEPKIISNSVREAFGGRVKVSRDLLDRNVKNIAVARKIS